MQSRPSLLLYCLVVVLVSGCSTGRTRYDSADKSYDAGRKFLEDGKCWRSQQIFQNLLSDFPGSHLVDDAQFHLGRAYFCSDDYVTAIFEFERVLNEYPTSEHVDDARYEIGMCYYEQSRDIHHDQSDTEKAIREFGRFIEDYPRSDRAADATQRIQELRNKLAYKMVMIAENYLKWKRPASAVRYCEEALRLYSDTDAIPSLNFSLARAKQQKGDYEEALEILIRLQAQDLETEFKAEVGEAIDEVRKDLSESPPDLPATVPTEESDPDSAAKAAADTGAGS